MATPMELNILWKQDYRMMKDSVKLALRLGYECVAINNQIDALKYFQTTKKKKEKPPQVNQPSDIKLKESDFNEIKSALGLKKSVRQCSRITVEMGDSNQTIKLQRDEVIRSYDIIAVRPTTEKLLQIACSTLDVDIISIDLTEKIPFKVKSGSLKLAMERGIMFEICYTPMIRDSGLRRYTIANGNMLAGLCKGKNIIFSSECEKPMELRGPYDVQNLGVLFNISEAQCKDAVFRNPAKCVVHGETAGKRVSKCVVTVRKLDDGDTDDEKKEEKGLGNMDFIELASDSSDEEKRTTRKHKPSSHANHGPRKKFKT